MLLHTHTIEENGETFGVHVLHAAPSEARALADALVNALEENPDVESYAITLGRVESIEPVAQEPGNGLILPQNGLIAP